ncbi:MAG: hypothetical protein ACT4PZ_16110 [Panacagrimonas sp.]
MSSEPDERELDEFLAGRDRIGAAYREASRGESAPAELDAAILLAAKEAVRTPLRRRPRWLQPLVVAATLVLSLGVLLNLWRDPETRQQVVPQPSAGIAEQNFELDGPVADRAAASAEPVEAKPEPKHGQAPSLARTEARPARRSKDSAAAMPESAAPQAAPPPVSPAAQAMTEQAAGAIAESREADAKRESESSSDALRASRFGSKAADPGAVDQAAILDPDTWIERIRKILERDDEKSARLELEAFRKAYPDRVLPDDLRKLSHDK